ncbi:tail fiber domain-containing protein [Aeromonas hydrophila]|uniref:tail fiber domain-containing protein n=1 Tax=Aeromonas hydrophila TaxID=644 RepID=UPI00244351CF|nr:tail fiber domain-containing protein [Aeromonas hydrophila]
MIQIHGVMTDPAGKLVPGAIIELRSITTTSEVLMGSVLTFKCDAAGRYRFPLAVGSYDVYAQNDQCGDMDYLGTGVVVSQGVDGPLNSILVDSGISLTPPLLERAVDAMQRAESAAEATGRDRTQTGNDVSAAQRASQLAAEQASAALASANTASSKAGEAATSATAATASATRALQWAENPLDVAVVTDKYSALHHAAKASDSATAATASASASETSATAAAAQATNASESAATATTKASDAAASAGTATLQANAALDAQVAAAASEAHALAHASNADSAAQASERAKVVTVEHAERVTTLAQQVSADRAVVETKSTEVATHAATVAVQSREVSTNAESVAQSKVAVQGMRDEVMAKTVQALAAADTASDKASQAAQDQAASATSAQQASMAKNQAEAWAQNPEGSDINGRPGEFSALHWALQAQKWAQAITSQLVWAGPWNASAGAPIAPAPNQGIPFYRISHSGVIASESYVVGDYLHWDPASRSWFKIDGTDAVISINGMTGAVVLSAADVGARPASWVPGWADVTGKPVTMPPSEHSHLWSQLSNIPVYATRWPTISEIGAASVSHTHAWSQLTGIPDYASRWPAWDEVTGKPEFAAVSHRHTWGQIDQVPVTASRWPSYTEVTDKPDFAPASHRHTWSQLDQVPVTASRWPSYAEVTGVPSRWMGAGSGNDYNAGGFEATGNGTTNTVFPTYGFHQPSLFAGSIQMRDDSSFSFYRQGAAAYADVIAHNGNFNDVYIRSDRRLKSNLTPITDALTKVKQLTGHLYDKTGQREAGLIAQDLAVVQPESVFLNLDGTLSIAHAGVLALLVEAVKALDEKLESRNDNSC